MNGLTELLSGVEELQPRKVEELMPDKDILPDTYIIYPTDGYHPFYGIPNTLPRYQQKIWPYIKRIKYNERYSEAWLDKAKKFNLRENHVLSQINPHFSKDYFYVNMFTKTSQFCGLLHRLIALAFIPNPKNKPIVMHINDDPTNYLRENLGWGTKKQNSKGKTNRRPDTMEQKYLNLVNKGVIKG